MSTVASIVTEIVADVTAYTAGLRQAADDTKRFAGAITSAMGNLKLVDEKKVAAQGTAIARGLTGALREQFAADSAAIKEAVARGTMDAAAFERNGVEAARRFNAGIVAQIDRLASAGKLTEPIRRALLAELQDAGFTAGKAMGQNIARGVSATVADVGRSLQAIGSRLASAGAQLSALFVAPLVAGVTFAVKKAADAVESDNLFSVALGKLAGEARKFSEDMQGALGVDATVTRGTVAAFDAMFKSMGFTERGALTLSTGLTSLTNDLSSFFNISRDDALQKLQSGITGEIEPLRRLGILVDENTVKAYAYAKGIAAPGATLTEQQKVLARYAAIVAQTTLAQGDLARTLGSPINQLRALQTEIAVTARTIGTALLPFLTEFVGIARSIAGVAKNAAEGFAALPGPVKTFIVALVGLTAAAIAALVPIGALVAALGGIAALAGTTIGTVVGIAAAVAVAGAGLIAFGKDIFDVAGRVLTALAPIGRFVAQVLVVTIGGALAVVIAGFRTFASDVIGIARFFARGFMLAFGPVIDFVATWGREIIRRIGVVVDIIVNTIRYAPFLQGFRDAFTGVLDFLGNLLAGFKVLGVALVNAIIQGVADAARAIPKVGPQIASAIESLLVGAGKTAQAEAVGTHVGAAYGAGVVKAVKAATKDLPKLTVPGNDAIRPDALGGTTTPKGPTALERQATAARELMTSYKAIQEIGLVGSKEGAAVARQILTAYDQALATVIRLGGSTAKGADDVRKALADLRAVDIVGILRLGEPIGLKLDVGNIGDLGRTTKTAMQDGLDAATREWFERFAGKIKAEGPGFALAEQIRNSLVGLKVPALKLAVDTSGVSGGLRGWAKSIDDAEQSVRRFGGRFAADFPVIASAAKAVAGTLDRLESAVLKVSAAISSPTAIASTALGALAGAAKASVSGLAAIGTGFVRTIVAALNPINLFASVASRVASALQPALDALTPVLEDLAAVVADALAPVFEALAPVIRAFIPVIKAILNVLTPILVALLPLIRAFVPILEALLPVIKGAAIALTYFGQVILTVGAVFLRIVGNIAIGFGKVIEGIARAVDALPGISAKGAIRAGEDVQNFGHSLLNAADEFKNSARELGRARDQIRGVQLDDTASAARAASSGLNGVADTARRVSEELRNIPEGFSVAALRYRSAAPTIVQPASPLPGKSQPFGMVPGAVGGGTSVVLAGDVIVVADQETTAARVFDQIVSQAERMADAKGGSSVGFSAALPDAVRSYRAAAALRARARG